MIERVKFAATALEDKESYCCSKKKGGKKVESVILCSANESGAEMDRSSGISNFRGE